MIGSRELQNREGTGANGSADVPAADSKRKAKLAAPEPRPLGERIAAARALRPPRDSHCGCCFGSGRDAAIRMIEGEGGA